jgi:outer membrane protein assembly factor BamA
MRSRKIVAAVYCLLFVTLVIGKSTKARGQQYTLREISIRNSPITPDGLRKLIPLKDGDLFDSYKPLPGLEQLRDIFADYSYIRMKYRQELIPESDGTVTVVIWIEAGRPFYIKSVAVLGAQERDLSKELARYSLERGKLYNRSSAERFFKRNAPASLANVAPQSRMQLETDDAGTVAVTFDFRE